MTGSEVQLWAFTTLIRSSIILSVCSISLDKGRREGESQTAWLPVLVLLMIVTFSESLLLFY